MHVVFVSSLVPVAGPSSGFDIANRVAVDAIRATGTKVSIIGFTLPDAEPAYPDDTILLGRQEVSNAKASMTAKLKWLAGSVAEGVPFSSAKMLSAGKSRFLANLAGLEPFDGLILNSVQLAGAFADIVTRYPFVFLAHNVEALSARQNAVNATSPFERALFAREEQLLDKLERRLATNAAHLWTLAEVDRLALRPAGDHSTTLPLVTTMALPASPDTRNPQYDLGLIGTWSWQSNRAGLDWFLHDVVPHLDPAISIAIAGSIANPPKVAHPGVRFLGRVPDARDFVRDCAVIPLVSRAGTGVQLKSIETFELGLPSVATDSALRGLHDVPDNCVRADNAEDFAAALATMVRRYRAGDVLYRDGGQFHAARLKSLDDAVRAGLADLTQASRQQQAVSG